MVGHSMFRERLKMRLLLAVALMLASAAFAAAPSGSCTFSQTSGPAPLTVSYDCSAVTGGTKPYHNIIFSASAGASLGTYTTGATAKSKGFLIGPTGGFLYTTPGTFTLPLNKCNSAGECSATQTQTITVTNPDVVFASTATVCIAASTLPVAGSGGCPPGAAVQNATTAYGTADFDQALLACIGTTKRCLFKRGDTFISSTTAQITTTGPAIVGAYGTGALPIVSATNISGILNPHTGATDIRFMDLDIRGSGASDTSVAVSVTAAASKLTFYGISISETNAGILVQSGASITGAGFFGNTITNLNGTAGVGIFGHLIDSTIAGNTVGPFYASAEHNIRIQPGQRVAVLNNSLTTPGTSGRQVLTIRALSHVDATTDTRFVHVSGNKLIGGGSSAQLFQMAPANTTDNHWISDVIADGNWIVMGSAGQDGIYMHASDVTVRNNICDASGASAYRTCFSVTASDINGGVPEPTGDEFLNNTCYASDSSSQFICVYWDGGTGSVINPVAKNNLAYAPAGTVVGTAGTVTNPTTATNTGDVGSISTSPQFIGPLTTPNGFTVASGSYAAAGGTASFPAQKSDFFNCFDKSAANRIGAVVQQGQRQCRGVGQ